tara:strand:+ start:57 stop:296 length:240 start_codon:yes stop_codon:yes gene_type:complete
MDKSAIVKKAKEESKSNNVAKKEESIPEKIRESYKSILIQSRQFAEEEIKVSTLKVKAMGVLEVFLQMYPGLKEENIEG